MALQRVGFVAIPPGAQPGFDHADVRPTDGRVYVAHTGADRVDVLAEAVLELVRRWAAGEP